MSAAARIAVFAALLGVIFAAAAFAGAQLDPSVGSEPRHQGGMTSGDHGN